MKSVKSWLLLMHQIAPKSDSFRVKVWRSLQKLGALQLKNSVYVLPSNAEHQKKMELIVREINSGQGDAFLCESKFIDGIENEDIIAKFNEDRGERYSTLAKEIRDLQKILQSKQISENMLMEIEHSLGKFERQAHEVQTIDFFNCKEQLPTSKLLETVISKIGALKSGTSTKGISKKNRDDYQGMIWVTRQNIYEDRMASIWLISKFIDEQPSFKFVKESSYRPAKNEIRFDMFAAEFTHVGDKCTFEVLVESFGLLDKRVGIISEIIHDLDLKDTKFNRAETAGIGLVISGIANSEKTDQGRIGKAKALFDDLFASLRSTRKSRS